MIALALVRFLGRTPWSSLMALAGVALGITSIVAVHLISATLVAQMDALVPRPLAAFDYIASRDKLPASDYFALRRAWRAGELPAIAGMSPIIDETRVVNGEALRIVGIDLFAQADLLNTSVVARARDTGGGDPLAGIWVDVGTGQAWDAAGVNPLPAPVNGFLDLPAGFVIADIGVAQQLLGWQEDRLSYVGLTRTVAVGRLLDRVERIAPGFSAGLPELPGPALPGWRVQAVDSQHPASALGKSVLFNVSALGMLALVVAWFLIYQVAVAWLRRLWGVFERLHVLGVAFGTLRNYFLGLLAGVGLLAALLGIVVGDWLAGLLLDVAVPAGVPPMSLDGWVLVKAIGSAVGVCGLGGGWAFLSLRRQKLGMTPAGGSAGALAGLALCLAAAISGVAVEALALFGGFMSIAALSVALIFLVPPTLAYLRRRSAAWSGSLLWRMGVREVVWRPRDLSVALAGLTLAIATAVGVGTMVDSFRADFEAMLERRLAYAMSLDGPADALDAVAQRLADATGIERVQAFREQQARIDGQPVLVVSTRVDEAEARRYGHGAALAGDEVLLSEQLARDLAVAVGDRVMLLDAPRRIAGIFQGFGDVTPRAIVDRAPAGTSEGLLTGISYDGLLPAAVQTTLQEQFPELTFRSQGAVREVALITFDQTFAITRVLITVAMLVAGIGVYIAVTVLRLNQTASQRLLTGMGLSRRENLALDFYRSLGIGGIAVLLAVPLGLVFGWILCAVINPRAFGWTIAMQLSPGALAWPVFWGVLAAVGAGLLRVGRREEGWLAG